MKKLNYREIQLLDFAIITRIKFIEDLLKNIYKEELISMYKKDVEDLKKLAEKLTGVEQ